MSAEIKQLGDTGTVMPFGSESAAVDFVVEALTPFCHAIKREPEFANGLRPDLGIRLKALPDIPLVVEVKRFEASRIVPLPDAIGQASTYADLTGYASFVAPLLGHSLTRFTWNSSAVGAALLVAGQFNVGGLYFTSSDRHGMGGLMLSGVQVAFFSYTENGDPHTRLHDNARQLLKAKQRSGSAVWR